MTTKENIKKEFELSIVESSKILLFLQDKLEKDAAKKFSFHMEYQKWYSKAIKLVETFGNERLADFKSYYEIDPKRKSLGYGTFVIQDYIKGVGPSHYSHPDFDSKNETLTNVYNQYSILNSIFERLNSVLSNIQTELLFEIQEMEFNSAKALLKINARASGVLCGVILEAHLGKVIENHSIKSPKKNLTLSDYNELLKNNNVYDTTVWKKILYLGDLRNLCAHKKDKEPTIVQVEELLDGVNWALKNIQ